MKFKSVLLLFVMLFLTSCTRSIAVTVSQDDEWVVVGTFAHGWFWDIYGVNSNNPQDIVSDMAYIGGHADWSPDGQWVAYSTKYKATQETSEIYLVKNDGTNRWKLGKGDYPAWSPRGNQIAYTFHDEIYVFDLDCLFDVKVCNHQSASMLTVGQNPAWSPDGQRMTFELKNEIYVINSDGTGLRKVFVAQNGGCAEPDWSPIEDKLLFRCWGDNVGFYTVNSDGTVMAKIEGGGVYPKWSPSGKKIAFVSYLSVNSVAGAHTAVYVMNSDGSDLARLTSTESERIFGLSWMPPHMKPEVCTVFCK